MKTLLICALVASAALTGAASAQVGSGAAAAVMHFNADQDMTSEIRRIPADGFDGTTVSTRSGNLGKAFDVRNASVDSTGELRGLNGATLISGEPAYAADIFARIKAESAENE